SPEARQLARDYYANLADVARKGDYNESVNLVRRYGYESAEIWHSLRGDMPEDLVD
ncbi:MAG TPA: fatty acid metabolism transcriptional regulator FadR, partial [Idiomarina sp.]|nr:fatty acid metabolism transcriptional regulator FadR [Idiomarina sp.]